MEKSQVNPDSPFLGDIESISQKTRYSTPTPSTSILANYSSTDIANLSNLPTSLIKLSPIETIIVQHAAANKSPKSIAVSLGLPQAAINKVLSNKDVSAYLDELVKARNKAIEAYLPNMLMDIIEAKLEDIHNDPEKNLGDASKRDIADIAKIVAEMTNKSQVSDTQKSDGVTAFYQQLNIIASQNQ